MCESLWQERAWGKVNVSHVGGEAREFGPRERERESIWRAHLPSWRDFPVHVCETTVIAHTWVTHLLTQAATLLLIWGLSACRVSVCWHTLLYIFRATLSWLSRKKHGMNLCGRWQPNVRELLSAKDRFYLFELKVIKQIEISVWTWWDWTGHVFICVMFMSESNLTVSLGIPLLTDLTLLFSLL